MALFLTATAVVLAITQVECRYLTRINRSPASDTITVQRRIWNDEVQPCIEKYCYNFINTDSYGGCMRRFCRRSVRLVNAKPSKNFSNTRSTGALLPPLFPAASSEMGLTKADVTRAAVWLSMCKNMACADDPDPSCVQLKCIYNQNGPFKQSSPPINDEVISLEE